MGWAWLDTSHKLLSHYDQFLATINLSKLGRMHRKTKNKKKWPTHLGKAKAAYPIELKARERANI